MSFVTFKKIPALALHFRNCQLARRVFVLLHWVDPPNRTSPFSEMVQMKPPAWYYQPRPRGPSSHRLSYPQM
jgi:hypothetical protein